MTFKKLVTDSHDMTSKKPKPTTDDIGLPILRKSISEPRLPSDIDNRFATKRNHRHIASAAPRIVIAKGPSARRNSVGPDPNGDLQQSRNIQERGDVSRVTADRSIDMINPRNFPVIMSKNFLRRRANAVDNYAPNETMNADRHRVNGGLSVTNGKYGSPGGPGTEHTHQSRGILKRREQGPSRNGWQQLENGHKTKTDLTLPGMAWKKSDGSSVLAGFPGNKSDLQGGRSSVASACSWQTYPLSSRPFSTHRGSRYLRGDQRMLQTNGFIPRPNDAYPINTNTRIRTRFSTPGQQEHVPPLNNVDKSDQNNAQLPSENETDVLISKPTTESLQLRRPATTSNGLRTHSNRANGVPEDAMDEEDNRNFRVRDWLSSLDSTLCQRYARRQMASLGEYEVSNQKS